MLIMFLPFCLFTSDLAAAKLRHRNPFPPGSVFFHVYWAFFLQSNARAAGPPICAAQCLFRENLDGQLRRRAYCSNLALEQRENFPFKCGGAHTGGKTFHSNAVVIASSGLISGVQTASSSARGGSASSPRNHPASS